METLRDKSAPFEIILNAELIFAAMKLTECQSDAWKLNGNSMEI